MQVDAAVLWGVRQEWSVEPVEMDAPGPGELMVRVVATGLCHSDDHAVTGDMPNPFPVIGGHEGAGVVEAIGAGVSRFKSGDHVVLVFLPPCGRCYYCATQRSNLCVGEDLSIATGAQERPVHFHAKGQDIAATGGLGTFSPYAIVSEEAAVKIDPDIPLESASLLGCAVTTGWGASVYLAEVRPGDNVVVVGAGGVGINAIQGATNAGADVVVAVDPVKFKQEQAVTFGATHVADSIEAATDLIAELTAGRMADAAILCTGVGRSGAIGSLLGLVARGGIAVITSVSPYGENSVDMSLSDFTLAQKTLRGNVYGGVNVHRDIPLLLGLYRRGKLKLDELVTARYPLTDINVGYADMHAGKNLRGVVVHSH